MMIKQLRHRWGKPAIKADEGPSQDELNELVRAVWWWQTSEEARHHDLFHLLECGNNPHHPPLYAEILELVKGADEYIRPGLHVVLRCHDCDHGRTVIPKLILRAYQSRTTQ